jgi:pseudouridine synthase
MSDERGRSTVLEYVKTKERVFPVGRLDRNTTGVLLLTNDGEFANALMHPRNVVDKAYQVTLTAPITAEHLKRLSGGIRLSDGKTSPAELHLIPAGKNKVVGIIIHEGRNRQVHRMFEALGYEIEKLDRVAYAGITYEGLKRGEWRYLKRSEVRRLEARAGVASKPDF